MRALRRAALFYGRGRPRMACKSGRLAEENKRPHDRRTRRNDLGARIAKEAASPFLRPRASLLRASPRDTAGNHAPLGWFKQVPWTRRASSTATPTESLDAAQPRPGWQIAVILIALNRRATPRDNSKIIESGNDMMKRLSVGRSYSQDLW